MIGIEKEENKYLSPSRLIKWLFPDKYKDIPEWVLERAAEQGKDLHELIEAYINGADVKDIEELIFSEKDKRAFNAVKNWYDNLKKPKSTLDMRTEFHIENKKTKIHGYLDLIDFENKIFYDFKFRNLKQELDITTEILQMIFYEIILNYGYEWMLIFVDKSTGEIKQFSKNDLKNKQWQDFNYLLIQAITAYQELERMEHIVWNKKKILKI